MNKYSIPVFAVMVSIVLLTMSAIGSYFWILEMPGWALLFLCIFVVLSVLQYRLIEPFLRAFKEDRRMHFWMITIVIGIAIGVVLGNALDLPSIAIDPPLSTEQSFTDEEKARLVTFWGYEAIFGIIMTAVAYFRPRRKKQPVADRGFRITIPDDIRSN